MMWPYQFGSAIAASNQAKIFDHKHKMPVCASGQLINPAAFVMSVFCKCDGVNDVAARLRSEPDRFAWGRWLERRG
jgi:hypothetical protein